MENLFENYVFFKKFFNLFNMCLDILRKREIKLLKYNFLNITIYKISVIYEYIYKKIVCPFEKMKIIIYRVYKCIRGLHNMFFSRNKTI